MNPSEIRAGLRRLVVLGVLLCTSCSVMSFQPASPLFGNWQDSDRNKVTFTPNAIVVTPFNGQATTLGPAACNGRYQLLYGRMMTADLQRSFPSQPDLQNTLERLLTRSEYPVADLTCDQGGTTYLMLDGNNVLAVYRDSGVGGSERLSRI